MNAHGLPEGSIEIPHKIWIRLVRDYTREAGVRELDRAVAAICRKAARDIVRRQDHQDSISPSALGGDPWPAPLRVRPNITEDQIGVAIGLGTTEIGGELIPVEVATMPGKWRSDPHRPGRRCHAGVGPRRTSYARSRAANLRSILISRRNSICTSTCRKVPPQGRTIRRHHHGDGLDLSTDQTTGTRRYRDDRRNHASWSCAADWWVQGQDARRPSAWHSAHDRTGRQSPRSAKIPEGIRNDMEFFFVTMDEVIAAAILLDDTLVDGLLGQIEPLEGATLPDAVAAAQLQAQQGGDSTSA